LDKKKIILGVCGGIAAYKSAQLVRELVRGGAAVRVVMTPAAQAFVTPLTFQALSGNPVHVDLLDPTAEAAMGHIELARWADTVVVAPASADFAARLSHGMADDLLSTLCLATTAPIILAPAMNVRMWQNAATRANMALLAKRGMRILGPAIGTQACGESGPGRMLEPGELARLILPAKDGGPLSGKSVLLTAGPTREPLDPVRYLSNRSSGKMGFALARAAAEMGGRVVLICGPCGLPTPTGVARINVETALQMHARVMHHAADMDLFLAVAAVADYRAEQQADCKIKKCGDNLTLQLVQNPDILAEVAALKQRPFCVGFAAETDQLERYARDKLARKELDIIAANQVGGVDCPFESDRNALRVFWAGGEATIERSSKRQVATQLLQIVINRMSGGHGKQDRTETA